MSVRSAFSRDRAASRRTSASGLGDSRWSVLPAAQVAGRVSVAPVDVTRAVWTGIGGDPALLDRLSEPFVPTGALPSSFHVEELGAAAISAVGLAVAEVLQAPRVTLNGDRVADAIRSEQCLRIGDEEPESVWDPLSSIFPAADGSVRLHGNYAQHRAAITRRFGTDDPIAVAGAIAADPAGVIEDSVHAAGGVAAAARSLDEWATHPAGRPLGDQPLVATVNRNDWLPIGSNSPLPGQAGSVDGAPGPLTGLRVLELTRVIAGPVTGRTLSWFGADVLRIESPDHRELRTLIVDTGPGKCSTTLDLRTARGLSTLHELVAGTDVFIDGLRHGALDGLGLYPERRAVLAPGLIDAAITAYGPGPWAQRRGFDSLVQLSSGLGLAEARAVDPAALLPRALPCQILDHATGLLMAAAIIRAAGARLLDGRGRTLTASLARTAHELASFGQVAFGGTAPQPPRTGALVLDGPYGATAHAPFPISVAGIHAGWRTGPPLVGQDPPTWN